MLKNRRKFFNNKKYVLMGIFVFAINSFGASRSWRSDSLKQKQQQNLTRQQKRSQAMEEWLKKRDLTEEQQLEDVAPFAAQRSAEDRYFAFSDRHAKMFEKRRNGLGDDDWIKEQSRLYGKKKWKEEMERRSSGSGK